MSKKYSGAIIFRLLFVVLCSMANHQYATKIGLCVMATGRYVEFAKQLIPSAQKYFLPNHHVTYFIFTDGVLQETEHIKRIEQKRLGWPHDTMMRFEVYWNSREQLKDMDYIFALDADMLFVDTVGDEILSDRVATQHPGFVGKRGSYETNPCSTACIKNNEGAYYFAGGFYGGSAQEFLTMMEICLTNIQHDLKRNFIAVWHDESHLNRYFIDHQPTKILSPSYCYPESCSLPYHKRLLALDKNHDTVRA